jgi:hypothetical protein
MSRIHAESLCFFASLGPTTTTKIATMATANAPTATAPIYVDTQHEDLVHDAQLDYYGCKLATSSSGELS